MKKIIVDNYEEMSQLSVDLIVATCLQDKRINISLTGGSTPKKMYEKLRKKLKQLPELSNIHYYTFDETPIKNQNHEVVGYDNFDGLNRSFFKPAKIPHNQIHAMTAENYQTFPKEIDAAGGLELMVIGIGEDGHFCANMPECTFYDKEVYEVELTNEYPWNEPYQQSLNGNYSDNMYTLGLPALLKVKKLVLIANGEKKARAIKKAIEGPMTPDFPSSYLRLHPNLVVIIDKAAAESLTDGSV